MTDRMEMSPQDPTEPGIIPLSAEEMQQCLAEAWGRANPFAKAALDAAHEIKRLRDSNTSTLKIRPILCQDPNFLGV